MISNLSIIVAVFCTLPALAQVVDSTEPAPSSKKAAFGIKAGLNVSRFSANVNQESRPLIGWHLGIYARTTVSRQIYFLPELYYSVQGQQNNYLYSPSGPSIGSTTTTLSYLNVPLLFEFGGKVRFQIGPQFGLLLSGNEKGIVASENVNKSVSDVTSALDLAGVVGLAISPIDKLTVGARYNMGFNDIYTGDSKSVVKYPTISNRVFHFYIAYSF